MTVSIRISAARTKAVANVSGGYYTNNQLTINVTIDEQNHAVREYVDREGPVILKKVQAVDSTPVLNDPTHWTQTYYVYIGRERQLLARKIIRNIYRVW